MIEWSDVIVSGIGVLGGGLLGSVVMHFLEKKKYIAEVQQASNIATTQVQETYQKIISDLRAELDISNRKIAEIERKLDDSEHDRRVMKDALYSILDMTCSVDCSKRHCYPSKEIERIMEQLK